MQIWNDIQQRQKLLCSYSFKYYSIDTFIYGFFYKTVGAYGVCASIYFTQTKLHYYYTENSL